MLTYPDIDPVALSIGPLDIRWYGLMYLIGFVGGYWLLAKRSEKAGSGWTKDQVSDLIFYSAIGVIVGGRLGYVLFYNFAGLMDDPLTLFKVWQGGMSFHGGLIGVMFSLFWYGKKTGRHVMDILDFGAPIAPIGLGAGRIGNFIGGELWGRVSDAPWAMVFPGGGPLPRHPSQLYQAVLEGLVLFLILWFYSKKKRPRYAISGMLGVCYGLFRFVVEFYRQPDAHLNFIAFDWLTMGQLLSLPMIFIGLAFLAVAYRKPAL